MRTILALALLLSFASCKKDEVCKPQEASQELRDKFKEILDGKPPIIIIMNDKTGGSW